MMLKNKNIRRYFVFFKALSDLPKVSNRTTRIGHSPKMNYKTPFDILRLREAGRTGLF